MNLYRLAPLLAFAVLATARTVDAQQPLRPPDPPGWSVIPTLQTFGVYENNLLFSVGSQTDGAFMRVSPGLETRFRGPVGSLGFAYSFDSERHTPGQQSLDDLLARQFGSVTFEARPNERSSFNGQLRYIATRRPEEILDQTGLVASRRETSNFLGRLEVDTQLSTRSQLRFGYEATLDDYGRLIGTRPGAQNSLQTATASFTVQKTPKTLIGLEYKSSVLNGDEFTILSNSHGTFWAHTVGLRWSRSISPHVIAAITAGPRVAQALPAVIAKSSTTALDWQITPDVLASLTYRRPNYVFGTAYQRSQFLGFGASGFINTENVEVRAAWAATRRLRVSARPIVYRNELAGLHALSYRFDGTASYQASGWISIDSLYEYRHQDNALVLSDFVVTSVAKTRTRNRLLFGISLRRPLPLE